MGLNSDKYGALEHQVQADSIPKKCDEVVVKNSYSRQQLCGKKKNNKKIKVIYQTRLIKVTSTSPQSRRPKKKKLNQEIDNRDKYFIIEKLGD